jgi:MinD superfamily P-loop ATPase
VDAPPGTSCPLVETVRDCDFVILVTEPTPFGRHDLKLAVDVVRSMALPFGVVINRAGLGDAGVHRLCRAEGIQLLGEIHDDRSIAEAYSRGELIAQALPAYKGVFLGLLDAVTREALAACA